jgi:hypothetical protein
VLRRLHFLNTTRVHQTSSWVVSGPNLGRFGPSRCSAQVFTLSVLELFHGWKIYDYLIYTRYRFLQRETRWKGLEDSLDECIDESVRTLDQMCFSSQYYMMMTVLTQRVFRTFPSLKLRRRRRRDAAPPRRRRRDRQSVDASRAGAAAVS